MSPRFAMKKYHCFYFFLLVLIASSAPVVCAQEKFEKKSLGEEATETIQVSDGYQLIVPKGSKVEQVGSQVKVEDPTEYLLKKMTDIEARLQKIEANQEELEREIQVLQTAPKDSPVLLELLSKMQQEQEDSKKEIGDIQQWINSGVKK